MTYILKTIFINSPTHYLELSIHCHLIFRDYSRLYLAQNYDFGMSCNWFQFICTHAARE